MKSYNHLKHVLLSMPSGSQEKKSGRNKDYLIDIYDRLTRKK
jgi:hypothetical protein